MFCGADHALRIRGIGDCHPRRSASADCSIGQPKRISLARCRDRMDRQLPQQAGAFAGAGRRACADTSGGLREPETAGFYVGFVAGVLGANPTEAEHLVVNMLPLPPADQWLVVRAIAYSGLPAWKSLLARVAAKVPARRGMIDAYLTGALPTLDTIELDKGPTFLEKSRLTLRRQAQGTGGVLRAQSRAGRHAVGQVFRRRPVPADLVHHHAAALVERSRQRRAAHGRQRRQNIPSPTTPRATPT
jgi:hypothetical protein